MRVRVVVCVLVLCALLQCAAPVRALRKAPAPKAGSPPTPPTPAKEAPAVEDYHEEDDAAKGSDDYDLGSTDDLVGDVVSKHMDREQGADGDVDFDKAVDSVLNAKRYRTHDDEFAEGMRYAEASGHGVGTHGAGHTRRASDDDDEEFEDGVRSGGGDADVRNERAEFEDSLEDGEGDEEDGEGDGEEDTMFHEGLSRHKRFHRDNVSYKKRDFVHELRSDESFQARQEELIKALAEKTAGTLMGGFVKSMPVNKDESTFDPAATALGAWHQTFAGPHPVDYLTMPGSLRRDGSPMPPIPGMVPLNTHHPAYAANAAKIGFSPELGPQHGGAGAAAGAGGAAGAAAGGAGAAHAQQARHGGYWGEWGIPKQLYDGLSTDDVHKLVQAQHAPATATGTATSTPASSAETPHAKQAHPLAGQPHHALSMLQLPSAEDHAHFWDGYKSGFDQEFARFTAFLKEEGRESEL